MKRSACLTFDKEERMIDYISLAKWLNLLK